MVVTVDIVFTPERKFKTPTGTTGAKTIMFCSRLKMNTVWL
jgi:hypothetical protein